MLLSCGCDVFCGFVCDICLPPQRLNTDFVGTSLFIYCKTKDFCCSSFQELPHPTHTPLKAPEVVAWLACPLSCLKAGCRWKIYDRMPWKPHIPFEVLLFLWWCPRWWRLQWDRSFPHGGGAIQGERGGRVHADMLLYRHSCFGGRFLLAPPLQMCLRSSQQESW